LVEFLVAYGQKKSCKLHRPEKKTDQRQGAISKELPIKETSKKE
jgi:hypothetical protein